ncbi:MAG: amylo-alpha-1,6-glucosidase [archaeon]
MNQLINKATEISIECLKSSYGPLGIKTGGTRDTYWSWDSFFASFGAAEIKEFAIVKLTFETFLKYQNSEGALPRRISAPLPFYLLKFITPRFHPEIKKPSYSLIPFFAPPKFQNIVFLTAFRHYIEKSGDIPFLRKHYVQLVYALGYIESSQKKGLIFENYLENWDESILKKGYVLFTNSLYYKALNDMIYLNKLLKKPFHEETYRAGIVKKRINELFWVGDYYADSIDKYTDLTFSTPGNLAAALFGIADKKKSLKILKFIQSKGIDTPLPSKTNWPKYPFGKINPLNWVVLRAYHNESIWIWIGCLNIQLKLKLGKKEEAKADMLKIADKIIKDKTVSEIYDSTGNQFKDHFYTAETSFAWSSGLFIYTAAQFDKLY